MRRLPNPASLTPQEREEYRVAFMGKSTIAARHDPGTGDGSVYFTYDAPGRFSFVAFRGKAIRPAEHVWVRSEERRAELIAEWIRGVQQSLALRQERRAASRGPHSLTVGAVLYTSWGYDQTNVEFFEVVGVRGAVVDLREIAVRETATSDMTAKCMPVVGNYISDVYRGKRPSKSNTIRICSCRIAWPWDGRARSSSSYA